MVVAELEESIAGVNEARVERARLDVLDREADKLGHGRRLRGRSQRPSRRPDAYPGEVFHGRVRTIGSATTGSFALLPSPNPSGNFTKITQRLPVRIEIESAGERLAPGMMVEVHIDVRD